MEKSMTDTNPAKSTRTSSPRKFVQSLQPFHNNGKSGNGPSNASLWGQWETHPTKESIYAVYSYRRSWPLFINWRGVWFSNGTKYSRTTSKHHGTAHPHTQTVGLTLPEMCSFVTHNEPPRNALLGAVTLKLISDPDVIAMAAEERIKMGQQP
jgi:hypothetical protein